MRERLAALLVLVAGALVPAQPATAAACRDVFPASFGAQLARDFPRQRVTAAVYDNRSGCWYYLHPDLRLTTASVLKAGILGAVLLKAQDAGRGLSASEAARAAPMMRLSHNPPTNSLYGTAGGVAGMDAFDRRIGARATRNTSTWGVTTTSAADRTLVAFRLLHGGGPLDRAARDSAWRYMTTTHHTQRWGITAGVPVGYEVGLKNGFYPMSGAPAWRVGSTGMVKVKGTQNGWAITVLTDQNPDQATGIRLVETVSRRVAGVLGGGGALHPRSVERSVCTQARAGESWATVAGRVGVPATRAAEVRSVSGGNDAPLGGQRACAPELRP